MGITQKSNNYIAKTQTVQMEIVGIRRNDKFLGVTSQKPLFYHVTIQRYIGLYSDVCMCVIGGLRNVSSLSSIYQKRLNNRWLKC